MKRYGTVIKLKPEHQAKYVELHASPWAEIDAMIKACNIKNYSIYLRDGFLFSYFEYTGSDYEKDMEKMAADPLTKKWWDLCMPCQEPLDTNDVGEWWGSMEEVYHLD